MRGKWAQGIVPRNFRWVITDRLAVCERLGGYGPNHRKVRRQEEIIWVRENGFTYVVSLIGAPHNLHNYDELEMPWIHEPMPEGPDSDGRLLEVYQRLADLLAHGAKLVMHLEEVGDRLAGFVAGYLVWSGLVDIPEQAISVVEQLFERQMGPVGRSTVAMAVGLPAPR